KSYKLYGKKVELAGEKLKLAQEKFKFGMINVLELEQIKIEKLNSELDLNNSFFNLIRTQISIHKMLNKKFEMR
ncbi:MAG: TolC family protein, partial [Candidatus Cloacimonadota bacterium]|nr:TolC family protein [Candidatus Cloacimonadota bacterium]